MLSVLIYPVCALMFALCVWLTNRQARQGAPEFKIIATGALLGALTFALQYIPPPHWLMADFKRLITRPDTLSFTMILRP